MYYLKKLYCFKRSYQPQWVVKLSSQLPVSDLFAQYDKLIAYVGNSAIEGGFHVDLEELRSEFSHMHLTVNELLTQVGNRSFLPVDFQPEEYDTWRYANFYQAGYSFQYPFMDPNIGKQTHPDLTKDLLISRGATPFDPISFGNRYLINLDGIIHSTKLVENRLAVEDAALTYANKLSKNEAGIIRLPYNSIINRLTSSNVSRVTYYPDTVEIDIALPTGTSGFVVIAGQLYIPGMSGVVYSETLNCLKLNLSATNFKQRVLTLLTKTNDPTLDALINVLPVQDTTLYGNELVTYLINHTRSLLITHPKAFISYAIGAPDAELPGYYTVPGKVLSPAVDNRGCVVSYTATVLRTKTLVMVGGVQPYQKGFTYTARTASLLPMPANEKTLTNLSFFIFGNKK